MKTIQDQIQQIIGLTESEYDMLSFKMYLNLLAELSRSQIHLQRLLIDRKISNWFLVELDKINKEFYEASEPYLELDKAEIKTTYINYIKRLYQNYPSVLIDKVNTEELSYELIYLN